MDGLAKSVGQQKSDQFWLFHANDPLNNFAVSLMRENQVLVSAARWQHWSPICFATLICQKITKLLITQQQWKLEKNKHIFGIPKILKHD
jgi:hypothetical protein